MVVSRVPGAVLRAFLIMAVVCLPAAIVPGLGSDARPKASFFALLSGLIIYSEYRVPCPSLIEFRDARPFNRIRYGVLLATVLVLSLLLRDGAAPTAASRAVMAGAGWLGRMLDFSYSPVRLATLALGAGAGADQVALLRAAVGASFAIGVVGVVCLSRRLRGREWPGAAGALARDARFNLWVNLPMLAQSGGPGLVRRLERSAGLNLMLGLLLPFVVPAVAAMGGVALPMGGQGFVWAVTVWTVGSVNLVMRGLALARIALNLRRAREAGLARSLDDHHAVLLA